MKRETEDNVSPRCRRCGCTESDCRQCIAKTGKPCWWIQPDLCSACATTAELEEFYEPYAR